MGGIRSGQTNSAALLASQQLGNYNWIKRKNAYNEDDVDYTNLPEENMIVATWINDMGNNLKEFDVSLNPCFSSVFRTRSCSLTMKHYLLIKLTGCPSLACLPPPC